MIPIKDKYKKKQKKTTRFKENKLTDSNFFSDQLKQIF